MGSTVENQKRLLKTKPKVSRKTEGPEVPFEDDLSPPRARPKEKYLKRNDGGIARKTRVF